MSSFSSLLDCSYLATSWIADRVYPIIKSGKQLGVVAQLWAGLDDPIYGAGAGPADINVDLKRDRLLIPAFMLNQLLIQELDLED